VIPLARTAVLVEIGQRIVKETGFRLRRGDDESQFASEEEYARWLGLRHRERVWGEYFSNAMVVAIRIILAFG
jgi:hypothetical protein